MSICYALLCFLDKVPEDAAELKKFETKCEDLAIEGFAFSKVNESGCRLGIEGFASRLCVKVMSRV